MIHVGIVGYGYWGPNLVRNFVEVEDVRLAAVCDLVPERLAHAGKRYPQLRLTTDFNEMVADPGIDAIVVATPVSAHYELALAALRAGKHVLVEKPLAASSEQARRLVDEAARRGSVLMVDHTFAYSPAVRRIRELIASDRLGDIYYYDSTRVNLGLFQHDVNVLWDLAVHDLAIMDYVLPARPRAISATGMSHVDGQPENIAFLTCFYDNHLIAHVHVNWLAPAKIRRTLIGGDRQMVVYDDLEPSEKIKVYDKGINLQPTNGAMRQLRVDYRTGDMWCPKVPTTEALRTEVEEFVQCVATGARPATDGEVGLRIVEQLEAATLSMRERGRPVEVPSGGVPVPASHC